MEGMIFGPEAWVSVGEVGLGLRLVAIAAVLLVMALVAGFVLAVVFGSIECAGEEPFEVFDSDRAAPRSSASPPASERESIQACAK